jgi:hypothetical protein
VHDALVLTYPSLLETNLWHFQHGVSIANQVLMKITSIHAVVIHQLFFVYQEISLFFLIRNMGLRRV